MLIADELPIRTLSAIQESQAVATHVSRFTSNIRFTTPTACLNSKDQEVSMEHMEDKTKRPINTAYMRICLDFDSFSYNKRITQVGTFTATFVLKFSVHVYDVGTDLVKKDNRI